MRVLLDTDVTLDFVLQRMSHFVEAKEIFVLLTQSKFEAYFCAITPLNVAYIAQKLGAVQTRRSISKLLQLVKISEIDVKILQNAINSPTSDYEDAVQHESAVAENLDVIVTRNTNDFAGATVKIYSPTEFLAAL
jgi:predicted nucleic acid-binding protein